MPQSIEMSDNPEEDLAELNSILSGVESFGILHEEHISNIREVYVEYLCTADFELKDFRTEMIEEGYIDFKEYISDIYGWGAMYELFISLSRDEKLHAVRKYRDIIAIGLFSQEYLSYDEIMEKIKNEDY